MRFQFGAVCAIAAACVVASVATPAAATVFVFDVTVTARASSNVYSSSGPVVTLATPITFTMTWDVVDGAPVATTTDSQLGATNITQYFPSGAGASSTGVPFADDLRAVSGTQADFVDKLYFEHRTFVSNDPSQSREIRYAQFSGVAETDTRVGNSNRTQVANYVISGVSINPSENLVPPAPLTSSEIRSIQTFNFTAQAYDRLEPIFGGQFSGVSVNYYGTAVLRAVPEPTSWALMILGFGAVGGMARHRRLVAA